MRDAVHKLADEGPGGQTLRKLYYPRGWVLLSAMLEIRPSVPTHWRHPISPNGSNQSIPAIPGGGFTCGDRVLRLQKF